MSDGNFQFFGQESNGQTRSLARLNMLLHKQDGARIDWCDTLNSPKHAMWKRGEPLPSQKLNSMMVCACGETFDSHCLEQSKIHVPHLTAERRVR